MGAGASASEAVGGASQEQLRAAVQALPEGDRGKLQDALDAAGRAAVAPYLAEYFSKLRARDAKMVEDGTLLQTAMDPEASKKFRKESRAWYESDAKPLLTKSFQHHDPNGSNTLDKAEAAVFFKNLVGEDAAFSKAMAALAMELSIEQAAVILEQMVPPEDRETAKEQIEGRIKSVTQEAVADIQRKEETYCADRASKNVAAFKVLDTNGDGSLQLKEFLEAFEPNSQRNLDFHLALGFLTEEEVKEQKKAQERLQQIETDDSAGCCLQ